MSVILDALRRARSDKAAAALDPEHPDSGPPQTRALERVPAVEALAERSAYAQRRRSNILTLVIGSVLTTVLLTAAVFYLVAIRLGYVVGPGFLHSLRPEVTLPGGAPGTLPVVGAPQPTRGGTGSASASASGVGGISVGPNGIATPGPVSPLVAGVHGTSEMLSADNLPIAIYRSNNLPPPAPRPLGSGAGVNVDRNLIVTDADPSAAANAPAPRPRPNRPVVGSIIGDEADSVAYVNKRAVHAGDEVDGYRVMQITPDYVVFQKGDAPPLTLRPGQ